MRFQSLSVVCALTIFALVPAAQAQDVGITNPNVSTPTDMFFHLINIQDFPINTQVPIDEWTEEISYGSGTSTATCLSPVAGNTAGIENEYHTYRGYSSPSYVEYDIIENGVPRMHPERGISYDAVFDQTADFTLYWYLRTSSELPGAGGPGEQLDNVAPIVTPQIVVKATIKTGDSISVDDKSYDQGNPIAHGETEPAILAGDAGVHTVPPSTTPHQQVSRVTGEPGFVYEFRVPMEFDADKIPRASGYNLRIDVYIKNDACGDPGGDGSLMPNVVNVYSGPNARPRMNMAIMNPVRLEYLHPQFVGDDLVIHTSMNSAWGNYDVHEETIEVTITGPSPATSLQRAAIVQRTHEHYHHQEAVDVTYVWPYKTDRAQNGLYTVNVKFQNDQQNAEASGVAQFELGKGIVIGCGGVQESAQKLNDDCAQDTQADGVENAKESPGVEIVGVLGILAAALALARRRQA